MVVWRRGRRGRGEREGETERQRKGDREGGQRETQTERVRQREGERSTDYLCLQDRLHPLNICITKPFSHPK